ncbi:MAG: 4-alpha-glucanotransferase [Planctomycetia bacterium]|nr:4-alpha-glucanotransferase [Candidatus Brocadia sp.]QOJ06137.1 MAG: 4-alpha-glucanotransferase [Planctomycetia bacterium]TVL96300.1 MAG: 4-alpha-glucanotransferase [Candidatus Brocadia sp. BL1]HQU30510.1 4-alpha-glucanotransferase [Candidatus Brocadia sapporoensis]
MNRRSGILLHVTSLPASHGIGDFGETAYQFVDFLTETRQSLWQILPLNPTSTVYGNSPYSSNSAFAGNKNMISLDLLIRDGILLKSDMKSHSAFPNDIIEYDRVSAFKQDMLCSGYKNIRHTLEKNVEFETFCNENAHWLDDYTLYVTLKDSFHGAAWYDWPEDLRHRKEAAMSEWRNTLNDKILMEKFFQFLFFKQWFSLKKYCNSKNIHIIGDLPIYVTDDSVDVWAEPEIFKLDNSKKPTFVAGVPPDYFSTTGQRWGNPVYNWDILKGSGYSWWLKRIEHNLKLYDIVRLDHFRGFVSYWEIPVNEMTAIHGKWVDAPVKDFFNILYRHFPSLPIIAEDLGTITPDVREIMHMFGIPGMKVLLFAFGDDLPKNPYIPHNYTHQCIVYTGTHDNNTVKGWFKKEANTEDKKRIHRYLGKEITEDTIHQEMIRLAMMSVANTVIIPMQDVLGLGEESRMNLPSSSKNNWKWRLLPDQITSALRQELTETTIIFGRG